MKDVRVEIKCPECGTTALPVPPLLVYGPEFDRLSSWNFWRVVWVIGGVTAGVLAVSLWTWELPSAMRLVSGSAFVLWKTGGGLVLLLPLAGVWRAKRQPRIDQALATRIAWVMSGVVLNAVTYIAFSVGLLALGGLAAIVFA